MATIQLRNAAKYDQQLPHQLAAWDWLQEQLSADVIDQFAEMYRANPAPAWLPPALEIIKRWEGCKLEAYPDPATGGAPWTIGYGTTRLIDRPVRPGDKISQEMADELLLNEVEHLFVPGLFALLPMVQQWRPHQIAALTSWAYNVGLGAVEDSTLRKRLLAGEDRATVISEELPRWNKGAGKVMEGLTNRRRDEVRLFLGDQQLQQEPARLTPASPFTARLTPHITLGEFALGQEARRFERQHQIDTAAEIASFLERCRVAFGSKPVIITSGYRPPAVNRSVGGASQSEHLYDEPDTGAVDFYIKGVDINRVQEWCDSYWPYSIGYGAPKGFVHLGMRPGRPRVRWDY